MSRSILLNGVGCCAWGMLCYIIFIGGVIHGGIDLHQPVFCYLIVIVNGNILSVGAGEAADCHVEVSAVGAEHCFVYAVDDE